ncbi:deaminase [Leisingera sp. F5]|uniref:deoxycytidylate deaminase n=1 Tax=Leisingera sp. F5 TaxID=1813816 RepID=UPI0025C2F954|nr:deaminase [Leisingera sp. F5]
MTSPFSSTIGSAIDNKLAIWDKRFMELCETIAEWSEDRGRKVGCVIVGEGNTILSTGYNGLPRGVSALEENRHDRTSGEKYFWFEHAERNAIFNAARAGISLRNSKMYANHYPCADCSRAIIQSGIIELATRKRPEADQKFGQSMNISEQLFSEAGVNVRYL